MALQASGIADLVTTTQRELGRLKWTDLASDLQEYQALPNMMKKERVTFDSGYEIQFNLMNGTSGAARNIGLYQIENVNVNDVMITGSIPWRHSETSYAIEDHEVAFNRDPARIVELVKVRRADAMIDLAKLMETNFWGKPTDSTDTVKPFGIDYWLVYNATEGFNGGNPSGFTSGAAGISSSTYSRWSNWAGQYTNVTKSDLIAKMRKAATYCMFKGPIDVDDYSNGSNRFGYYTNYSVLGTLETLLEDQNENLGNDVASKDGQVMFRRNPVVWVPKLDANTANPVYGINWSKFYFVFLKGFYLKEGEPREAPNQRHVHTVHVDLTYNIKCCDRRANFVLATTSF